MILTNHAINLMILSKSHCRYSLFSSNFLSLSSDSIVHFLKHPTLSTYQPHLSQSFCVPTVPFSSSSSSSHPSSSVDSNVDSSKDESFVNASVISATFSAPPVKKSTSTSPTQRIPYYGHSFGVGAFGGLGHGDYQDRSTPSLIPSLSSTPLVDIASGWITNIAIDNVGRLYQWGHRQNMRSFLFLARLHNWMPNTVQFFQLKTRLGYFGLQNAKTAPVREPGWGLDTSVKASDVPRTDVELEKLVSGSSKNKPSVWARLLGLDSDRQIAAPTLSKSPSQSELSATSPSSSSSSSPFPYAWPDPGLPEPVKKLESPIINAPFLPAEDDDQSGYLMHGFDAPADPLVIYYPLPDRRRAVQASSGGEFCAVVDDHGDVYTWGSNFFGQTGHSSSLFNAQVYKPKRIETLAQMGIKITQVACGYAHLLVLTEYGSVYVCGKCDEGALGLMQADRYEKRVFHPHLLPFTSDSPGVDDPLTLSPHWGTYCTRSHP